MDDKLTAWNPLEFLVENEEFELKPQDVYTLGVRTLEIANVYNLTLSGETSKVCGREVGDDRVDLSLSPDPLCAMLVVQEDVIKMITSFEDTSIRKKSWNFCEVTSGPLTDPTQGYDFIRKAGNFENLGYSDAAILRIILDVQKGGGEDHSSTQPGKMSMLGSRLATPRKENRGTWMLASLFQDAMLCTHRASEPKYLPQVMGGTGVTALFDNSNNVFLYVLAYKGGTYRRIYASACAEMQNYLYSLERGIQSAPILCPRLREKQEYFWGTYDNLIFVPAHIAVKSGDMPPIPLYAATGGQNRYQLFENRLLRTRQVLTRRAANTEWQHSRRLRSIFQSLFPTMDEFRVIDENRSRTLRARYDNALSANTALANLLKRKASKSDAIAMMGSDAFLTVTSGKRDFTRQDAEWVYLNGQGENYSLNDTTLSEDIFVREEVSSEETFKVTGIPLRPYHFSGEKLRLTKAKVGLYQINSTMEEWAENLLGRLVTQRNLLNRPLNPLEVGPIFDQDPEWVNDDSGLIGQCLRDVSSHSARYVVALVSDDRRLANQMAETCNVKVIRVSANSFAKLIAHSGKTLNAQTDSKILSSAVDADFYYVDTGSIMASAVKLCHESGVLYTRNVIDTGWINNKRFSKVTLTEVKKSRMRTEVHNPVTRPRIYRSGSRPHESVYSSHLSWKDSRKSASSESSWWRSKPPLTNRTGESSPETIFPN